MCKKTAIIIAIIGLTINLVLCFNFAQFADTKGYSFKKYFWICFFFGMIGYVWVAALPDISLLNKITELERKIANAGFNNTTPSNLHFTRKQDNSDYKTTTATLSEDGQWICGYCQTKNSMNYGQCKKCGKYKKMQ